MSSIEASSLNMKVRLTVANIMENLYVILIIFITRRQFREKVDALEKK